MTINEKVVDKTYAIPYTYRYLLPLEMECVHTIINIGCFSAFRENFSQAKQVETGMTFG